MSLDNLKAIESSKSILEDQRNSSSPGITWSIVKVCSHLRHALAIKQSLQMTLVGMRKETTCKNGAEHMRTLVASVG